LKPHAFQLLLNFPLLFVQLVLSLLLLLQLLLQPLLLPEGLLITAALSQGGTLESSTGSCFFGANPCGENTETQQKAGRLQCRTQGH
jgi:hypothetical protein